MEQQAVQSSSKDEGNSTDLTAEFVTELLSVCFDASSVAAACELSQIDRTVLHGDSVIESIALTYGELLLSTWIQIMTEHVKPAATGESFVDLGSGSGRIVLATAIAFPQVISCVGVELLPSLHQMATDAQSKLQQHTEQLPAATAAATTAALSRVTFVHADFFAHDWSRCTIVFLNSTMYTAAMMSNISKRCEQLPLHARVITVTNQLSTAALRMFTLLHSSVNDSSWGKSTVFVYEKTNNRRLENVILRAFRV